MSIFMNSFFPSTSKMIPSLTNDASALMIGKCFPDLNTVFCMKVIDIPTYIATHVALERNDLQFIVIYNNRLFI